MAIQVINPTMPAGRACELRALPNSVKIGDTIIEGDIADGVDIVDGAHYVVVGSPANGTISYDGDDYNIGQEFDGGSETDFTRSTSTVRIVRTKPTAVSTTALGNNWYVVVGGSGDSIIFNGVTYPPGSIIRGMQLTFTVRGSATVFLIESINKIETLAMYHFGSKLLPNELDYSSSLGIRNSSAAAVPASNLNRVYFWNYGSSAARLIIKAYVSALDREIDAERSDALVTLPANEEPWIWVPTEPFRQGGEGNAFGENAEDRRRTINAFVFQTDSQNQGIWIKPESNTLSGLMQ